METPDASLPSPPTTSSTSPSTNSHIPAIQKSFSCVLCSQRKVKCDKNPRGCSNCNKARAQCIYRAPPPPRRRKKRGQEVDITTRIKLYEAALRRLGVNPADIASGESQLLQGGDSGSPAGNSADDTLFDGNAEAPRADPGLFVVEEGKSRYLENNLWTSLKGEFRDPAALLQDSSDDEEPKGTEYSTPEFFPDVDDMLLGFPRPSGSLHDLHPPPVQIFRLWQVYLENVHPLVKVLHVPTVQQLLLNSIGNLVALPRNLEALLFSIYCCAINSLGDSECDAILGQTKVACARRFRTASRQALVNAGLLKSSDMIVLQAFVLYLMSLNGYDAKSLWILTGVACRLGQRTGLHRDGETLGLPVFETEMRRRLWWQIVGQDGYAEKLAGTGTVMILGDTKMPSNLNDSDLFPDMKELPKEHDGPTEMMFFLIRSHVGDFLRRSAPKATFDGSWSRLSGTSIPTERKDKAIDDFEELIERKFLRHCDESIPWHFMCAFLGKAVICTMRFVAHNPYQYEDDGASMPQWEKDMLFSNCLRIISYQNLAYTQKGVKGFAWHVNTHFQWKACIYILQELSRRGGDGGHEAWRQLGLTYEFHPEFITDGPKRPLLFAIGNLTLKAWEAFKRGRSDSEQDDPHFIQLLRSQRSVQAEAPLSKPRPEDSLSMEDMATSLGDYGKPLNPLWAGDGFSSTFDFNEPFDPLSPSAFPPMEFDQHWEDLLHNFQMQGPNA
ncbi:uncharacterized protein BDZ99DRAFT_78680 [Mytilinidion resinicola]|uniref:Zn(2)-C6 fungal-type domain-containing protein n=1 Tax=Mytilinidion resinicola TaxID=574789 RepID=A0A6A6YFG3_9PEZI|nr:uncharacterized protein BDZ99DRAFT_78680 [Mytilinidion resinicola]KAF2807318.1 hypothetical protein BDZ99DRAFT_78680 [Mytilinidion resinicola]